MGWLITLTAVGLLLILRKRSNPRWLWMVKAALAAFAGAGLAETGLGAWLAGVLRSLGGWVGGVFGAPAGPTLSVLALLIAVVVVLDIAVDHKADRAAIAGLILLPLLFVGAAGPVADGGSQLFAAIHGAAAAALGPLIGG